MPYFIWILFIFLYFPVSDLRSQPGYHITFSLHVSLGSDGFSDLFLVTLKVWIFVQIEVWFTYSESRDLTLWFYAFQQLHTPKTIRLCIVNIKSYIGNIVRQILLMYLYLGGFSHIGTQFTKNFPATFHL